MLKLMAICSQHVEDEGEIHTMWSKRQAYATVLDRSRWHSSETWCIIKRLIIFNHRVTLDTPANRKSMPDADFSSWTPLEFIAE